MFKNNSANSIADRLSVSHTLVQKIRDELVKAKEIDAPEKVIGKDRKSRTPNIIQTKQPITVIGCDKPKRETTTTTSTRQVETVKHVEPIDDEPVDEDETEVYEEGNSEINNYDKIEFNDQVSLIFCEIESTKHNVNDLYVTVTSLPDLLNENESNCNL